MTSEISDGELILLIDEITPSGLDDSEPTNSGHS